MKAWTIVAVTHDGELVCCDCYTPEEQRVADDKKTSDDISVIFANDECVDTDSCSRCGTPLKDIVA